MDSTLASSVEITILEVFQGDTYTLPDSPMLELNDRFEGGARIITYNGTELAEVYMNLLTSIEFDNDLDEPRDGNRRLTVKLVAPTDLPGSYLESNLAEVTINVLPLNDNDPVFTQDLYNGSVVENSPITVVTFVVAMDNDIYGDTNITYEIVPDNANFRIDPTTGIILTTRALDAEVAPSYSFTVVAFDNDGNPGRSSTTSVYIEVNDTNDNSPIFEQTSYTVSVSENVEVQSVVLQVTATDSDTSAVNSDIRYEILPPEQGSGAPIDPLPESPLDPTAELPFVINPQTGEISLIDSLDFEATQQFSFTVQATDTGSPTMTGTALVVVKVTDANDNVPQFVNTPYMLVLNESELISNVLAVSAVDADSGTNGEVTYSVRDTDQFIIDGSTGVISLVNTLDYESQPSLNFTVIASDSGSPQRSSEEQVYVTVLNVNDNVPQFSETFYEFFISENYPLSVLVVASDDDDQQITFLATTGFSPYFELDAFTGVITSVQNFTFDYEEQQQFDLVVGATDGVFSVFVNITINVLDVNDLPPVFASSSYLAVINESLTVGSIILQVVAEDGDEGSNAEVEYILSPSENSVPFSVNIQTGDIVVASTLDFDSLPIQHTFSVIARNTIPPYFNDSTLVTVQLTDTNDIRPMLLLSERNITFEENSDAQLIATAIVVTDSDSADHPVTMCSVVLDRELCDSPGVDICRESISVDEISATQLGLNVNVLDEIENQTITISGSASEVDYQQVLASLEYANTAQEPNPGVRSVSIQCFDADFASDVLQISIDVLLISEFCPVISASQLSFTYTEEAGALAIGNRAGFTLSDQDRAPHNTLMQLQVTLINRLDGESEFISATATSGLDISSSDNVGSGASVLPDTLTITATGPATLSAYSQFLQTLSYENSHNEPTPGLRQIQISPIDSASACTPLLLNITITLLNDNPPNISTVRTISYYDEGTGDLDFAVEAGLMVSDTDNNQIFLLQSATIVLQGVVDIGMEMLAYDSSMLPSGVSAMLSDNGSQIRLQFIGGASVQDYEALLLSLTYSNNASEPTPGNRTVTMIVSDGIQQDDTVVIVIVILVDDNPVNIQADNPRLVFTEGNVSIVVGVLSGVTLVDRDRDPVVDNITITLVGVRDHNNEFLSINASLVTDDVIQDDSVITITRRSSLANYQVRYKYQ